MQTTLLIDYLPIIAPYVCVGMYDARINIVRAKRRTVYAVTCLSESALVLLGRRVTHPKTIGTLLRAFKTGRYATMLCKYESLTGIFAGEAFCVCGFGQIYLENYLPVKF